MNLRSICKVPFAVTPECRNTRITPHEFLSMEQHLCSSSGELHPANCLAGAFRFATHRAVGHQISTFQSQQTYRPTISGGENGMHAWPRMTRIAHQPTSSEFQLEPDNPGQGTPARTVNPIEQVSPGSITRKLARLIRSVRTQASLSISTYRSLPSTDSKPGNEGRTRKNPCL